VYWRFAGDEAAAHIGNYTGLPTTVTSSTSMSVDLPASFFGTAGDHKLIVVNPTPGGGASDEFTFSVTGTNPVPDIATVDKTTFGTGTEKVVLTLTGAAPGPRFTTRTIISAIGTAIPTTDLGWCTKLSNTCSVTLPASLMTQAGTITLTATNPSPGGGSGTTVSIDVVAGNPTPQFVNVVPKSVTRLATPSQRINIQGSGFNASTTVRETQSNTTLTVAGLTPPWLQVDVPAALLDGTYANLVLEISNPGPAGGTVSTGNIPVVPGPWITSTSPEPFTHATAFTLTITGTGLDLVPNGSRRLRFDGPGLEGTTATPTTTSATTWTVDFPNTTFPLAGQINMWVEIDGYPSSNTAAVHAQ
jgi:hypothetical protein